MLFLLVHINDEELQFGMEVVFWPRSVPGGMSADGIQGWREVCQVRIYSWCSKKTRENGVNLFQMQILLINNHLPDDDGWLLCKDAKSIL